MLTIKEIEELLHELKSGKVESEKKLIAFLKHENAQEVMGSMTKSYQSCQVLLELRDYAMTHNTESSKLLRVGFGLSPLHILIAMGEVNDPKKLAEIPEDEHYLFKKPDNLGLIPLYDAIKYDRKFVEEFYEKNLLCLADSAIRMTHYFRMPEGSGFKESEEIIHRPLLHALADIGDLEVINKIKKSRATVNLMCQDSDGDWPIHCAIDNDRVEVLSALFDSRMNTTFSKSGGNLIHRAAVHFESNCRSIEMLEILTSFGQDINHVNLHGETPLYKIFFINKPHETSRLKTRDERCKLATALVKHGADINLPASYSTMQIECDFMISKNLETGAYTVMCSTAPHLAIFVPDMEPYLNDDGSLKSSAIEVFSQALNLTPTINHRLTHLLHRCVEESRYQQTREEAEYNHRVMQFLIQNGADLAAMNQDNITALELAEHLNLPGAKLLLHSYEEKQKKQVAKALVENTSLGNNFNAPISVVMQYLYKSSGQP